VFQSLFSNALFFNTFTQIICEGIRGSELSKLFLAILKTFQHSNQLTCGIRLDSDALSIHLHSLHLCGDR
jgi:hypothetical protein